MVLGYIVETVSEMDLLSYHRQHVLTPDMWVPETDLLLGETFAEDQENREPWYDSRDSTGTCVFDRDGFSACDEDNQVDTPYGSWDHESYRGFGGIVASAATMLELGNRYRIQRLSADIGQPLGNLAGHHTGGISGTKTILVQRSDGVNVFIFLNAWVDGAAAKDFYDDYLNDSSNPNYLGNQSWPTTDIGGFWIDPEPSSRHWVYWKWFGSYDVPFNDLDNALAYLADGSRVNFKVPPGETANSTWTGTISTKLLLKAPLGTVVIGSAP